jgi:hypothetical protein
MPVRPVSVTKAELLEDELDDAEADELEDDADDADVVPVPDICTPTVPFTAATTPAIGARSSVWARVFFAFVTAICA